ncbi:MAG: hypothetical protein KGI63_07015, partial [Xanthomonadaceae bacterium]|nr:hypothetical protein [Xanthomonadaceae bacterium]
MTSAASAWLRDQARPVRALLGTGIAAGLLQAALMCLGAWMLAHVLAGAIFHGRRWRMAWPWLLALLALAALRFVLGLLQRRA